MRTKITSLFIALALSVGLLQAQNDTMYVMKAGAIVGKYQVLTQVDSVIFYNPRKSNTLTDIDGNEYKTVTIGTQTWMAENLRTTKYNDGTAIPLVTDKTLWANNYTNKTKNPMMCYYDNSTSNAATYGGLYNWYVVSTSKLCPTGWHVPTDTEWTTLTDGLGGEPVAGSKLKATTVWNSPNIGATNETGFTALPGGDRNGIGACRNIGDYGYWWSASADDAASAWGRYMNVNYFSALRVSILNVSGLSVRCLKD